MSTDQNLPGKSLGDAGLNVPLDPPPAAKPTTQAVEVISTPPEILAINAFMQPMLEAFQKGQEQQLKLAEMSARTEAERLAIERLRIERASHSADFLTKVVAGVILLLLAIAVVSVVQNKDALAQYLFSGVIGILAGFGIGQSGKPK